ncbi:family 10 glycosylhydrolase [Myxococcota bacterium]|nr:family 10 glycosylhydrolase [Myxococcota bacterium]
MNMPRKNLWILMCLTLLLAVACDDGSSKNHVNNTNNINNTSNVNNVVNPALVRIDVSPGTVTLNPGGTVQLAATGTWDDDSSRDVTGEVVWSSDATAIATVDASGFVTAVAVGGSTVTAAMGDVTGQATIAVEPELADVAHEREFRAAWVATVWGINFPSSTSSMSAQQAELIDILDALAAHGFNAVVFQVRPEGDALYASTLEPWSRFLTGTQGQDPGYDPLDFLITEAHARNIEVHAWLNPYRALVSRTTTTAAGHVSRRFPEYAYPWGDSLLWMDPGAVVVRDHIISVVMDIVDRYDVDGIHFDDYFYPWPATGYTFPDAPLYQAYTAAGGSMSLADWRRNNVDEMIRIIGEDIAAVKPHVRFGIGPFGIWKAGEPAGVTGTSQYDVLYSDPKKWIQEGYVDYIAPQLYWPTTSSGQPYEPLLTWWAGLSSERYIFAGNALYQLGSSGSWTVDEFRQEVQIGRNLRGSGSMGNIYYHVDNILTDKSGVASMLSDEFYHTAALTPPVVAARDEVPAWPQVTVVGGTITLAHPDPAAVRAWVVYSDVAGAWVLDRIVPAAETSFTLASGTWAISAASLGNVESRAVVVTME